MSGLEAESPLAGEESHTALPLGLKHCWHWQTYLDMIEFLKEASDLLHGSSLFAASKRSGGRPPKNDQRKEKDR